MKELDLKIRIPGHEQVIAWTNAVKAYSYSLWLGIKNDQKSKYFLTIIVIVFALTAWRYDIRSGTLWAIFFAFYLYKFDTRILTATALILMAGAPISIAIDRESVADSFLVNTFFLLLMVLVLEIREEYFGKTRAVVESRPSRITEENEKKADAVESSVDMDSFFRESKLDLLKLADKDEISRRKKGEFIVWLHSSVMITAKNLKTQPILWLFSTLIIVLAISFYYINFYSVQQGNESKVQISTEKNADTDKDMLMDKEEQELGMNIYLRDTDSDGISDFEEVKKFKTDPLKQDSDGDGHLDLIELNHGYDPNGPGKLK